MARVVIEHSASFCREIPCPCDPDLDFDLNLVLYLDADKLAKICSVDSTLSTSFHKSADVLKIGDKERDADERGQTRQKDAGFGGPKGRRYALIVHSRTWGQACPSR